MALCNQCHGLLQSKAHPALSSTGLSLCSEGTTETLQCQVCGTNWSRFLSWPNGLRPLASWRIVFGARLSALRVAQFFLRRRRFALPGG